MNRFFIGLIAGAASIIGGTYFYRTKVKKEIDEKGAFHRTFFVVILKVDIRNKNEDNNATTEA